MASASPPIRLLAVDDDAIVRTWIGQVVRGTEFRLVAVASTASEALDLASRYEADIYLVDQILPDWRGTELIRELRLRGHTAPALLMTAAPLAGLNEEARAAGAQGTAVKSADAETFLDALRSLSHGNERFTAPHPAAVHITLSPREREVIQHLAAGATNAEIAAALAIKPETVKTLLNRAFAKLGVKRRGEAVDAAHRLGLLSDRRRTT